MKKYIKSSKGVESIASEIVSTLYNEHPEIDYIGDAKTKSGDMVLQFDIKKTSYEDFKAIINYLFNKYMDRIGFGTSQYRNAPEIKHPSIIIKKASKKVESATNSCGIPAKVNIESSDDKIEWVVYINSDGGTRRELVSFDTEQEAKDFCEDNDWRWVDENRFEWTLDYEDVPYSETIKSSTTITARKRDMNIKTLNDELYNVASKYMRSEGFYLDEIAEYLNIDAEDVGNGVYRAEVRAELSYDGMRKLADKLDKVIRKYDKDAYFDDVDSGIIEAYIRTGEAK